MQSKAVSWKCPQHNYSAFPLQKRHLWRVPGEGKMPHHTHRAQTRTKAWDESCHSKGHIPHTHRGWSEIKWSGSSGWLTSGCMDNIECKFMGAVFYLWNKRKSIQTHGPSQHFPLSTSSLCVSAQGFGSKSDTEILSVEELKDTESELCCHVHCPCASPNPYVPTLPKPVIHCNPRSFLPGFLAASLTTSYSLLLPAHADLLFVLPSGETPVTYPRAWQPHSENRRAFEHLLCNLFPTTLHSAL